MKCQAYLLFRYISYIFVIFIVSLMSSCSLHHTNVPESNLLSYDVDGDSLLAQNAPTFVIERPGDDWNRIASPVIQENHRERKVTLDSDTATIYAETRRWKGARDVYTNLIYRVHFTKIPFRLIPFNLTAGKNVGLMVIITINSRKEPVLVTTVHTCGCYLAFIPTSHLDQHSWPENWKSERQRIYGEILPGMLTIEQGFEESPLVLLLRESTHRVKDVHLHSDSESQLHLQAHLAPMQSLSDIEDGDQGITHSFFETEGSRKDYVIDSHKIWERLFISWWALDWRVGEDKRLGQDTSDGIVFYTSLKPWARRESDLRDFANFLQYWGWNL
ncbi:hypothetical protein [Desulfosediminicola sp.]|uniref:hypothetical protein n=1 Tax=Desulfosediminicola sp. TaxID=2886825 RepID=UPI003AF21B0C